MRFFALFPDTFFSKSSEKQPSILVVYWNANADNGKNIKFNVDGDVLVSILRNPFIEAHGVRTLDIMIAK